MRPYDILLCGLETYGSEARRHTRPEGILVYTAMRPEDILVCYEALRAMRPEDILVCMSSGLIYDILVHTAMRPEDILVRHTSMSSASPSDTCLRHIPELTATTRPKKKGKKYRYLRHVAEPLVEHVYCAFERRFHSCDFFSVFLKTQRLVTRRLPFTPTFAPPYLH
jgi:hypothetical protein